MASSFPGTRKSTRSGSQLVSVMATIGTWSLRASATAIASWVGSMMKTALGTPLIPFIPPMYFSRRARSLSRRTVSFLGSWP